MCGWEPSGPGRAGRSALCPASPAHKKALVGSGTSPREGMS